MNEQSLTLNNNSHPITKEQQGDQIRYVRQFDLRDVYKDFSESISQDELILYTGFRKIFITGLGLEIMVM